MAVTYLDSFDRTHGSNLSGQTIPNSSLTWGSFIVGTWTINNSKAFTSTAHSSDPLITVDAGTPDVDITCDISNGGGDAIYIRVGTTNNWYRLRFRKWTTSSTSYTTEYEWRQNYTSNDWHFSGWGGPNGASSSLTGWGSYSSPPSFPSSGPSDSHYHIEYGNGYYQPSTGTTTHSHAMEVKSGSPFKTGNTRTVQSGTSTSTHYYTYLERNFSGTISTIASRSGAVTSLRLVGDGTTLTAFAGTTQFYSGTQSGGSAYTHHGIGRGASEFSGTALDNFKIIIGNTVPNPPVLLNPVNNGTVDYTLTNRFSWSFSDPDAGDTQSRYELRYRVQGTTTWTIIASTTPNAYTDIASGTFTANTYEWQVRVADNLGEWSAFSGSKYFIAGIQPDSPSITDPINGQTISEDSYVVAWSTPVQTHYQVRTVADDGAGAPNTAVVYYDSGEVASSNSRSLTVPFATNDRTEHVQVRVQSEGLWSNYASISVNVSYTPPIAATFLLSPFVTEGAMRVDITNPADPEPAEVQAVSNRIYRKEATETEWSLRKVVGLNTFWLDYEVASGISYEYRVTVVGDNGTSTDSDVRVESVTFTDWWIRDIENPSNDTIIDVEQKDFDMSRGKDIAFFNPLGRERSVALEGDFRSEDFSLTIATTTPEDYVAIKALLQIKRTLLIKAPIYGEQWYVRIQSPIKTKIINVVEPYVHFIVNFIAVSDPALTAET